jgi:hypothetical protein
MVVPRLGVMVQDVGGPIGVGAPPSSPVPGSPGTGVPGPPLEELLELEVDPLDEPPEDVPRAPG